MLVTSEPFVLVLVASDQILYLKKKLRPWKYNNLLIPPLPSSKPTNRIKDGVFMQKETSGLLKKRLQLFFHAKQLNMLLCVNNIYVRKGCLLC